MRVKANDRVPCPYSPVWTLPASRFGNNRWIFYSVKLGRLVTSYSDLEHDNCVRVEADPSVVCYCEQPLRVRVKTPSGFVTTVFDMWLLYDSGREEFREVKYLAQLKELKVQRQIAAQRLWCERESKAHEVFDESRIRQDPLLLTNWKFILRCLASYHRHDFTSIRAKILQLLTSGSMTLGDLQRAITAQANCVRTAVFTLLHDGQITAPLDRYTITTALQLALS